MTPSEPPLAVDPARAIADLRALAALTSDERGAQRVAWTAPWDAGRAWLEGELAALPRPVRTWRGAADALWAQLDGEPGAPVIAVGSHLDSVPDGGWLDGALGVVAGLEVLRAAAETGWRDATLRLVDWADEEGRFGHSLLASSAATGVLDPEAVAVLRDRDGIAFADVARERALDLTAPGGLDDVDALLELHIEQGPVLERLDAPLGVPTGSVAIHRAHVVVEGRAAHAGTTPLDDRRDAGLAAARLALAAREAARRLDGVATVGAVTLDPGIATAVPGRATLTLDLRHAADAGLAEIVAAIGNEAEKIARAERVAVRIEPLWSIPAVTFDTTLVAQVRAAVGDDAPAMISGALHDAVAVARAGLPTAMLFVRSIGGISHNAIEDSSEADLAAGVRALADTVVRTAAAVRR